MMPHNDLGVMRVLAALVTLVWGSIRIAVVMGWATPGSTELAVQVISGTDAVMMLFAGYYYGSTSGANRRQVTPAEPPQAS